MIAISKPDLGVEEYQAMTRVFTSNRFVGGEETLSFERDFARYIGVKYASTCSNGTTAIQLALEGLGIKRDDKVMVPSFTAFPTVEAIYNVGAKPVFVDVDYTYTINTDDLERKYVSGVKALLGVHLYGHPFDVKPARKFCNEKGIFLVEDCAQAVGAEYNGKKVGSFGDAAAFSFYPSKNMTVGGDGGMVTTNKSKVIEKVALLKNHGQLTRYSHVLVGHNYRMSEIQAAIGREQLKKLDEFNVVRRLIAKQYDYRIYGVKTPFEESWARHVYHLYVVRSKYRDQLKEHLARHDIMSEIHYPILTHRSPAIHSRANLVNSQRYSEQILSIPMHTSLTSDEVTYIIDTINSFQVKNEQSL